MPFVYYFFENIFVHCMQNCFMRAVDSFIAINVGGWCVEKWSKLAVHKILNLYLKLLKNHKNLAIVNKNFHGVGLGHRHMPRQDFAPC